MDKEVIIEEMQEGDLDQIMEIWLKENINAHDFIDIDYWVNNYRPVAQAIVNSEVYIARVDGEIVGFIGADDSYIQGLFVDIYYRNSGLGSRLLKHLASRHEKLDLRVYKKNEGAIAFYKKAGFNIVGEELDKENEELEYLMSN